MIQSSYALWDLLHTILICKVTVLLCRNFGVVWRHNTDNKATAGNMMCCLICTPICSSLLVSGIPFQSCFENNLLGSCSIKTYLEGSLPTLHSKLQPFQLIGCFSLGYKPGQADTWYYASKNTQSGSKKYKKWPNFKGTVMWKGSRKKPYFSVIYPIIWTFHKLPALAVFMPQFARFPHIESCIFNAASIR